MADNNKLTEIQGLHDVTTSASSQPTALPWHVRQQINSLAMSPYAAIIGSPNLTLDHADWLHQQLDRNPTQSAPVASPTISSVTPIPASPVLQEPVTSSLTECDSNAQLEQYATTPADTTKPPFDYKTLVTMALESGGSAGMTISCIYNYVLTNFSYYRSEHAPPTWRSRIRNVLTVNDCFKRIPDPKGGRKGRWVLHRTESNSEGGLKSPHTIGSDKSPKLMRRSGSSLLLTPTDSSAASDSEPPNSAVSLHDLEFSFDEDDVRNIDRRVTARANPTYFAPMKQSLTTTAMATSSALGGTPFGRISLENPSLTLSAVEVAGARALSAASMEMVDQLAMELKRECSMLTHSRTGSASSVPAPIG